jgi:thiamine-phosphate pyrophosphorylase
MWWHALMDTRLLDWGRASARRCGRRVPPLWLFTDSRRLPDPLGAALRLPKGLGGIVFRHDGAPDRIALGHGLARIARERRLALVVAGDPRLAAALGAGIHLRGGHWPGPLRARRGVVTSSAHSMRDLRRARRSGADLVFLSPTFPTASHPGAPAWGALRWSRLAQQAGVAVAALGGISGRSVRRLPRRFCRAIGAIEALQ